MNSHGNILQLDLNLMDLSYETIDLIMNFPCKIEDLCAVVRKISKNICIQIREELEHTHDANDLPGEESSSESEPDCDY